MRLPPFAKVATVRRIIRYILIFLTDMFLPSTASVQQVVRNFRGFPVRVK